MAVEMEIIGQGGLYYIKCNGKFYRNHFAIRNTAQLVVNTLSQLWVRKLAGKELDLENSFVGSISLTTPYSS